MRDGGRKKRNDFPFQVTAIRPPQTFAQTLTSKAFNLMNCQQICRVLASKINLRSDEQDYFTVEPFYQIIVFPYLI